VWQWFNYAEALAAERGRSILRVNLDETSVCLFPGRSKGAVFVSPKRLREGGGQQVPKWKRRCCLTHVALVCDRPDVQPTLPQFVIGNERTLLVRDLAALRGSCPRNVTLVRQKSAWSSAAVTARIVRELAVAVGSVRARLGDFQLVLLLDAARIHYAPAVLRACRAVGVWLVIIPAKMTWLLQPLDTHAFAQYKAHLLKAYQAARIGSASASGDVDIAEFLPCVYSAVRAVLQGRRWATAFERDGLGLRQSALSHSVQARLQLQAPLQVPSCRPSDEQVRLCLPRRAKVLPASLWNLYGDAAGRLALSSAAAAPRTLAPAGPVGASSGRAPRTRAEHRRAAGVAAAAAASTALSSTRRGAAVEAPVVYGRTRAHTRALKSASGPAPP